jgi:predicted enzyme related to lactoylglutathione lyase
LTKEDMKMANPVIWFQVMGQDGQRLRRFYGELFGWKMQVDDATDYGYIAAEEQGIRGGVGRSPEGVPDHVTFYVAVDDLASYLAKAEKLGGKTIVPPTEVAGGAATIAYFMDPEGHVIGLSGGHR